MKWTVVFGVDKYLAVGLLIWERDMANPLLTITRFHRTLWEK